MKSMHRGNKRGLSLLEVLIAAVIASLAIIPYLSLSSRETRSTFDLAQRAKALSLAQNTLTLLTNGHRKDLYNGNLQQNSGIHDSGKNSGITHAGIYELKNPDLVLNDAFLATGKGLSTWIGAQRRRGYFEYKVTWHPNPPDLTGINKENFFGELTCTVGWQANRKKRKQLTLRKITIR